jgi:hypothetical protein
MQKVGFKCELQIVPETGDELEGRDWILGLSFLKSYYAVFDLEEDGSRVGLART